MGYRHTPVIVRPNDLRDEHVPQAVAQAVRHGTAILVGFAPGEDPRALLRARRETSATARKAFVIPARRRAETSILIRVQAMSGRLAPPPATANTPVAGGTLKSEAWGSPPRYS